MTKYVDWRRLVTFATVDALLVVAAGAAWAAPAATPVAASAPALPALLLLGIGLVCVAWRRDVLA